MDGPRVRAFPAPARLASSTVADLVAGSGITFTDRGTHELKGVPGEWRIVAVAGEGANRERLDGATDGMRRSDRLAVRLARTMPRTMRTATRLSRRR
jgi:hypothetical protein